MFPSTKKGKHMLKLAYTSGFQTSVSVKPMLDSANIDALISELLPYVTQYYGLQNKPLRTIWEGFRYGFAASEKENQTGTD
jgi:hypothetical protein